MNPCGRGFLYEPRLNKTGAYFSAFSMVFFLVARLAGRPLPPLPPLGAVGSRVSSPLEVGPLMRKMDNGNKLLFSRFLFRPFLGSRLEGFPE